jgi:hypothetical protein
MAKDKDKDKKPETPQFKLVVDLQCGACSAIMHTREGVPGPKFCAGCGAGLEKFCLKCHKKVEMFFEEWWPEDDVCQRTYTTPRRCTNCNAVLETGGEDRGDEGFEE